MGKLSQRYVILLVIFTLVATGVTSAISYVYSYSQFKLNTENTLRDSSISYSYELNEIISSVETAVDTITRSLEASIDGARIDDPAYYEALSIQLEALAEKFDKNDFYATSFYVRFDPELSSGTAGVFHADIDNDNEMERQTPTDILAYDRNDITHVGWFFIPMGFEKADWMQPYFNANINTHMVSYVSPLRVDGRTIGIVGMDMDFRTLKRIADSHQGAGKVVIVDRNHAFMVHDTFKPEERLDTIESGNLAFMVARIEKEPNGTIHYSLEGLKKVLGYSKLKNGWTVIVALSESEAFFGFNRTAYILLMINIGVCLFMATLALLFGKHTTKVLSWNATLESEVRDRTSQLTETNEYLEEAVAELESQQAELTVLNTHLEESLEAQRIMQERLVLAEKLASLGELVAGIGHEINTPIGNAITLNSFLKEQVVELRKKMSDSRLSRLEFEELTQSMNDTCDISLNALGRVAGLIDMFKQMVTDQALLDVKKIQMRPLIDDVMLDYQERFSKDNHQLRIFGEDPLEILTYPVVLKQIYHQLIGNTLRHGFDGLLSHSITIRYSTENGIVTIIYEDDGHGMENAMKEKAFDPFVSSKKHKGAAGLGLHLVHNLVTQTLNGTITLESSPSEGTRYTIVFPELKLVKNV